MAQPERIIVGLGNPGERYARTRHNVGFRVLDALQHDVGAADWFVECKALVTHAELGGKEVLLAKPLTFMNLTGHSVESLISSYGLAPDRLVAVLDDLNLPLGRVRVRERGSAGGHHGLESILHVLRSDEFVRVRLGVGEADLPDDKADFVLSEFPSSSADEVEKMILRARDAVKSILSDGVARAMSRYNVSA